MKLIMMTDGSTTNFERMICAIPKYNSTYLNTENCDELHEFNYLIESVEDFQSSSKEIMLVKFSGRENIVKNLGDECSEMLIYLSYNKCSKYYTEHPIEMFLDLVNLFKKETLDGITIEKGTKK